MPFHQDVHETIMAEGWGGLEWNQEDIPVCDRACDDREAIEQSGYDCDCTPIDTLMGDPGLGFNVAWAMEHGDEPAYT
jgi:hypothetical protein